MAMDPEIRQALDDLRALVLEAQKASGAIEGASSSARQGSSTTGYSPQDARRSLQDGTSASSMVPGYVAASLMANSRLGQAIANEPKGAAALQTSAAAKALRVGEGISNARLKIPARQVMGQLLTGFRTYEDSNAHPEWDPFDDQKPGFRRVRALKVMSQLIPPTTFGGWMPSERRSFARRTGVEVATAMARTKAGMAAMGGYASRNAGQIIGIGMGAAYVASQWAERDYEARKTHYQSSLDVQEQIRQRNVSIARDMQDLADKQKSISQFQNVMDTGRAATNLAAQYVMGKALMTQGFAGMAARTPVTMIGYLAATAVLRGIDYFSGAEQERFDARSAEFKLSFREQTAHVLDKETVDKMQTSFAVDAMRQKGFWLNAWEWSTSAFANEKNEQEGMQLARAEYARQAPRIQEARESLSYGDAAMAERKFKEAADALRLGEDMPMMWRNPQKFFAEMESSRIASRNWARSQMSRAKIRTGD